jgi:hypothetical protein
MKKGQTKWTADQMIAALKETKGMVYLAAELLGCAPKTVYSYAQRFPTVQATMNAVTSSIPASWHSIAPCLKGKAGLSVSP